MEYGNEESDLFMSLPVVECPQKSLPVSNIAALIVIVTVVIVNMGCVDSRGERVMGGGMGKEWAGG